MHVSLSNPDAASDRLAAPRFQGASKFWLWPNLLSLDAPIVALLWQILFIRCFHVAAARAPAILLVASVWLIYAADRALDAWRGECGSPRHRFYRAYWRILLPLWIAVLAASAWLALTQLSELLLMRGCILLAAVTVYLIVIHGFQRHVRRLWSPPFTKEASVGFLFALGASLAAWTNVHTAVDAASIALFFILCWINCAAIQKWESSPWQGLGSPETMVSSTPGVEWPVSSAAVGVAVFAVALLWLHRPVLGGAEIASACAFVALDRMGRHFSPDTLRVLADVALLSPMVFLPLARGA